MSGTTENERPLSAILAQETARMLNWSVDMDGQTPGSGKAGEFIWHGAQLELEIATEVLHAMGVAIHVHNKANFQLAIDVDKVAAHVLTLSPDRLPPLDRTISAFIGIASLRDAIRVHPDSISRPPPELRPAMSALVSAGYAERADGLFAWCEKIRPAMGIQHMWPPTA